MGMERIRCREPANHVHALLLRRLLLGLLFALILLTVFLLIAFRYTDMSTFDHRISTYLQGLQTSRLTIVMLTLTTLGSAWAEIGLALLVSSYQYWRLHHFWEPALLVTTLIGARVLNEALKAFFRRSRPDVLRLVQVGGYSFPSGHAMISLAFYGMLAYLLWFNLRKRSHYAWVPAAALLVLALMIGVSRVYLGVHYPSDIVGGYAAGGAWLISCISALRAIRFFHPDAN
jgi:undecaprenyl-diphosphatase